jgi:hypothetical protein
VINRPNMVKAAALIFNLAVVAYLIWTLRHSPEGSNKAI